jgi:platelet/endothelial cell adhesion protein
MANALVAVFYTFLILNTIVEVDGGNNGSTPYLQTIIEGRCRYYLEFKETSPEMKLRDCDTIWNAFYNSFAFKNPCKLTFADYEPFFAAVKKV